MYINVTSVLRSLSIIENACIIKLHVSWKWTASTSREMREASLTCGAGGRGRRCAGGWWGRAPPSPSPRCCTPHPAWAPSAPPAASGHARCTWSRSPTPPSPSPGWLPPPPPLPPGLALHPLRHLLPVPTVAQAWQRSSVWARSSAPGMILRSWRLIPRASGWCPSEWNYCWLLIWSLLFF